MASYVRNKDLQVQEYEYSFAEDGGATGAIELSAKANKAPLPLGAIVKAVDIKVDDAVTGSGSVAIGSAAASATYKSATASAGYADNGLTVYSTPFVVTSDDLSKVVLTIAGATLTAGRIKVLVEFINPNS